jgi:hypothetical protein
VRAADLAPDAAVVRAVALGLGLVDVRHALPGVPRDVLLGVHAFDLNQRGGLVLVRLGPASRPPSSIKNEQRKPPLPPISWRVSSPLVSEDGAPDIEPHALTRASLHHLAAAASALEMRARSAEETTALLERGETLMGGGVVAVDKYPPVSDSRRPGLSLSNMNG